MFADQILAARGSLFDVGGYITSLAHGVEQAQRFEITEDIAQACLQLLRSRPSTMLKALSLCRLPYPTIWCECRGGFSDVDARPGAPIPTHQASLIEEIAPQVGVITICWVHKEHSTRDPMFANAIGASPFSIYFDWREDGDVRQVISRTHAAIAATTPQVRPLIGALEQGFFKQSTAEYCASFMTRRKEWHQWADDQHEVEALMQHERHMLPGLSPHCVRMMLDTLSVMTPAQTSQAIKSWKLDVEGEGPFVEFFLAMLNSRNCITREPVDLIKFNRARAKQRKPPMLNYTRLKLSLSNNQRRATAASGMPHDTARWHLVRGHFKVRKTGVYWWSSFGRGDPKRAGVKREKYVAA